MGRQNNRQMRAAEAQGRRGRGKRGGSSPRPLRFDLRDNVSRDVPETDTQIARRAYALINNKYVRHIKGFDPRAADLLLSAGLANVREDGDGCIVPVTFAGISQKPKKEIDYRRAGITVTRGGVIVLSGVVSKADLDEIGNGTSAVSQVDAPDLVGTHDSASRLNVALGRESSIVSSTKLSLALGDSSLVLSSVAVINDRSVRPYHGSQQIEEMWDRLAPPPVYRPAGDYYDTW